MIDNIDNYNLLSTSYVLGIVVSTWHTLSDVILTVTLLGK